MRLGNDAIAPRDQPTTMLQGNDLQGNPSPSGRFGRHDLFARTRSMVLTNRHFRTAFWLAAGLALILAILPKGPQIPGTSDKFQHILAFCTLAVLARLGFRNASDGLLALALFAFGAAIEVIQMQPVFQRHVQWDDLAADALAVAVTLGIMALVRTVQRNITVRDCLICLVIAAFIVLPVGYVVVGLWLGPKLLN